MEIKFSSDTKYRKEWLTGLHFAHPAKMHLSLQLWLIDRYTKEGEVILDPMAGSGTVLVACSMGRNVICVELEDKFVKMIKGNWGKIQQRGCQLGYSMGTATILQGDARYLLDVVITSPPYGQLADIVITSPPFADCQHNYKHGLKVLGDNFKGRKAWEMREHPLADVIMTSPPYAEMKKDDKRANDPEQIDKRAREFEKAGGDFHTPGRLRTIARHYAGYNEDKNNIGNLPYGNIDCVITSPPYEEAMGEKHHSPRADKLAEEKSNPVTYTDRVDCVISSPPYENAVHKQDEGHPDIGGGQRKENFQYAQDESNIGNLKGQSYLSAMLEVYQGCWRVLKPQGLMILITKNFIRNKQEIRLDFDTIRLCEQAGFRFAVRHYRKLTSQSFWRTIYQQKYPDAPILDKEDILVFQK